MSILIIADHGNGALKPATLNTVTAAAQLGTELHLLVVGENCAAVAEEAARIEGITTVLLADAPHYARQLAEEVAPLIARIAGDYTHVLAAAGTTGKDLMPRVAALLDVAQISEITAIESADTFVRPVYAGNVMASYQSADPVKVITVRATAFDAAVVGDNAATVQAVEATAEAGLTQFIEETLTVSERPELTAAKVVISGGRGMGSGENFGLLEELADQLGAAVGASRAAVDAGFVPNDYQVGQTGKVVAPELYVAVGISGAIQHMAGMKDSKIIVAINKDEEAPIFQMADYGIVGDLFEVLPQLSEALKQS